jgi:hypothetical protein
MTQPITQRWFEFPLPTGGFVHSANLTPMKVASRDGRKKASSKNLKVTGTVEPYIKSRQILLTIDAMVRLMR